MPKASKKPIEEAKASPKPSVLTKKRTELRDLKIRLVRQFVLKKAKGLTFQSIP